MNRRKIKAIAIAAAIILAVIVFVTLMVNYPMAIIFPIAGASLSVVIYGIYKLVYLSLKD
jgi:hypothetical protein